MKRLVRICVLALPLAALASPSFADVKTRDRSSFKLEGVAGKVIGLFAGKAAKEGVEGMTAVKGNRKATIGESTGRIVDLSEEKVYTLDMKKKTYTVKTFAEIREEMRKAAEDAKKGQEKEQPAEKPQAEKPQKEYEIDFDVKETGQKKQIAGYDAREAIATITVREKGKTLEDGGGMVMTNDVWLGPSIPQMKEMAEFDLRYWRQLEGADAMGISADQMAAVMAMYPTLKTAMDRYQKDGGSKLQGTALDTTSTFEAVKSKEQMEQEAQSAESSPAAGGGIGGMLARKLAKKKEQPNKARATVMTIHHEILEVSTSVAPADLSIPADFKEKK